MKVQALTKYTNLAASTRQRVQQYVAPLERAGITVKSTALLGDAYVANLATNAGYSKLDVIRAYAGRLKLILTACDADVIWVYAELFPYLPAAFEALIFRSGKPVIYDIDDAFFEQYDRRTGVSGALLREKLDVLMRRAALCCCGNAYLRDHVERRGGRAIILPTVVDTNAYTPTNARKSPLTIGWIGSPSTWSFVLPHLPLLRRLASEYGVRIRVVGAGVAAEAERFRQLDLIEWSESTEIDEVRRMDIGIMPLPDEPWARGKSGYKLIQYMACGLPVVASPVGVNAEIVVEGVTGLLATDPDEWELALRQLIASADLRAAMGLEGRTRAISHYSLQSQTPRLIKAFRDVVSGDTPSSA